MGLFDIFKKKKPEQEPGAAPGAAPVAASAWAQRFTGFWDWEDEQKKKVGFEFVADLATRFENGKVKETTDEDDVEVRGRIEGIPVRVKYELDMGWVNLEMKCQSPIDDLSLEWDPEKIPVHGGGDDDWDDDEELRVFVGKGVFVEGYKNSVQNVFDAIGALPSGTSEEIIRGMQERKLTYFNLSSERIHIGFKDNAYEMRDPIAEILEVAALAARVASTLGSGQVAPPVRSAVAAELPTCSYCGTKFYLGPSSACPNCGAAYGT